jgi:hypothetical protein
LDSDQIAWKDRAKDALSIHKKRNFFLAIYKKKKDPGSLLLDNPKYYLMTPFVTNK